ncbi:MAG: hypothetical protein M1835_005402 [Candelina submexicana]|nr:MAG: hypothetical protein M1835_005402 [Candelina submexicana]
MEVDANRNDPSIQSGDYKHLSEALDKALERYLNLLDRYQRLQQELAGILANGNLSLAQANFSSPTRIRYGSDFYDERMQATRRILVKKPPTSPPTFEHKHHSLVSAIDSGPSKESPVEKHESSEARTSNAQNAKSKNSDPGQASRDPLRWYGMFVPPALQSAQNSFSRAISEAIPSLANVVGDLSLCEEEIVKIRAELDAAR